MRRARTSRRLAVLGVVALLALPACSSGQDAKPDRAGTSGSPSGQQMPVGDLAGWRQTFTEDFTEGDVALGSWPGRYGRKWDAYPEPWHDTSGKGVYSPQRVLSIHGGVLDMYLHSEDGQAYVAAPEPDLNGSGARGQRYGRYSVRFKADPVPGYKTAWLLWPDTGKRSEGEIDFPEARLNGRIHGYVHHIGSERSQDDFPTDTTFATWHTATTEWSPGRVSFMMDGRLIGTSTTKVPDTRMHWVIQTETALEKPFPKAADAGHVLIDWVTAYKRSDDAPAG